MTAQAFVPCLDYQGRTCLLVKRANSQVRFIPLDVAEGLKVLSLSDKNFDARFKPMPDYPAKKAVQLYVRFAEETGATKEAMELLGTQVKLSKDQVAKATTKVVTVKAQDGTKTQKVVVRGEGRKKEGGSASSMFQELILAGELTDDDIFLQVQKKFNLDPSRRSYVGWYRKKLIKDGKDVPAVKTK